MRRILNRLTYANVMSTIAVFATLAGGTAYAAVKITTRDIADGAVTTKKLANGAVTSPKIRNRTVAAADLKQAEKFHLVGRAGQPKFMKGGENDCIWSNLTLSAPSPTHPFNPVGFYKDAYGVVHLTGAAQSVNGAGGDAACGTDTNDGFIFRLPKGYRPPRIVAFAVAGGNPGPTTQLWILGAKTISGATTLPAGTVVLASPAATGLTLDGIEFRAAGAGTGISARGTVRASEARLEKVLGR